MFELLKSIAIDAATFIGAGVVLLSFIGAAVQDFLATFLK